MLRRSLLFSVRLLPLIWRMVRYLCWQLILSLLLGLVWAGVSLNWRNRFNGIMRRGRCSVAWWPTARSSVLDFLHWLHCWLLVVGYNRSLNTLLRSLLRGFAGFSFLGWLHHSEVLIHSWLFEFSIFEGSSLSGRVGWHRWLQR